MRRMQSGWLLLALASLCQAGHAVDGEYDPTWPGNGRVRLDVSSGTDEAKAIFVQADGKVVIAGTCDSNSYCAARLLPNGSYDAGFGNTGLAGRFVQAFGGFPLYLSAAAPAADGGILLAGTGVGSRDFGLLFKLDPTGSLSGALQVFHPAVGGGYHLRVLAVQPDGKILVAGTATTGNNDFVVSRLLANLSGFDTSFGDIGTPGTKVIAFPGGGSDAVRAIALQPNGKIVLAGQAGSRVGIARLLTNGQLDDDPATGFGDAGLAVFSGGLDSSAYAVAVDRDGSVLVAGGGYGNTGPNPSYDFFVNR